MADYLITTVCSGDGFQYFVPPFIYCARQAYPEADVKIYIKGRILPRVRDALKLLDPQGWEIIENAFEAYPTTGYICNILRLFIPRHTIKKYKYTYVTDVDFLMFRQNPTHWEYYAKIMKANGQPYAAFRSAIRRPRRLHIAPTGWRGIHTRIVCGTLMLHSKAWAKVTKQAIYEYRYRFKRGAPDGTDRHRPGSYREQDEVVLYRIVNRCGLPTPRRKWHFTGGNRFNNKYRDVHVGDFKFVRRSRSKRKLRPLLSYSNIKNFKRLEKDPKWQEIIKIACEEHGIRESMRRLRRWVRGR